MLSQMLSGLPFAICPKLMKGVIKECLKDENFQTLITNKVSFSEFREASTFSKTYVIYRV